MKRLLLIVAIVFTTACAGKTVVVDAPEIAAAPNVNTDKTLQLIGRANIAQACPVEGTIYTAAHVVSEILDTGTELITPGYAFSTAEGNEGILIPAMVNNFRDIAILYVRRGVVNYYKRGTIPEDETKVYWREYTFDYDDVLSKHLVESEIVFTIAGHFVLTDEPVGGASGGCLFNEEGEVIGIVTWGIMGYGVAVSIVGQWNLQ